MNASEKKIEIAGKTIYMETGRIAKQANSAVLIREGSTAILVTVTAQDEPKPDLDFFPLTVEYREKMAAAGRIPGSFIRREGKISDHEVLISRLIDRSIRPLFPKGFKNEVQVTATVLSSGPDSDPGPLAIIGVGAALHISNVPWDGPAAGIRISRMDERNIILPNPTERELSDADLVVSSGPQGIVMVEGGAKVVPEDVILDMLFAAQKSAQPIINLIEKWREEVGREKMKFEYQETPEDLKKELKDKYGSELKEALRIVTKKERRAKVSEIIEKAVTTEASEESGRDAHTISKALDELVKEILRESIIKEGIRPDGRNPDEIRKIWIEVGWLKGPHGSAIFTRGETQALVTCTLGTGSDAQTIEGLLGEEQVKFLLHYNFPPYSVGEVRPLRGPGRREIGHGFLARRALEGVMPDFEDFPYVVRVESDIAESNGSSSMATVCGGCLALMDAGVPISAPVAGIAMGLIQEGQSTVVLTDILGDEDHLGDMDFKVAGTKDGITAMQMDNKIGGLSKEIMEMALEKARKARLFILQKMTEKLSEPRKELPKDAPRAVTMRIRPQNIGLLIGPKGLTIRGIQEETGADVTVDEDGLVTIFSRDEYSAKLAMKRVREAAGDVKKGRVYQATVTAVKDYGAFVKIYPHIEGLVHHTEWDEKPVRNMLTAARVGEEVLVRVMGADEKGRLVLSRKEALGTDPSDVAN